MDRSKTSHRKAFINQSRPAKEVDRIDWLLDVGFASMMAARLGAVTPQTVQQAHEGDGRVGLVGADFGRP